MTHNPVLYEQFTQRANQREWVKSALLVVAGVLALAICSKISIPIWPSPVPITLGTLAVLSIGAVYGPKLGLTTIGAFLVVGALGFDVFANSSSENNGLSYMFGGTGGYLVGFVLATLALGQAARLGWDRSVLRMGIAMLVGNVLIYLPGLLWLHQFASGWEQTLAWGLWPFLIGDLLKLAIAAMTFPIFWKLTQKMEPGLQGGD